MAHRLVATIAALAFSSWAAAQSVTITAPGFSAGLELRTEAQAVDVGLPWYPGAVVQRDNAKDEGAVQLGLWGGLFGFKLSVLKLASSDNLETVSAFYRTALARKYGASRLEAACTQAMAIRAPNLRSVTSILQCGLDGQPRPLATADNPVVAHENVRGPGYYH